MPLKSDTKAVSLSTVPRWLDGSGITAYQDGRLTSTAGQCTYSFDDLIQLLFSCSSRMATCSCRPELLWNSRTKSTATFFLSTAAGTLMPNFGLKDTSRVDKVVSMMTRGFSDDANAPEIVTIPPRCVRPQSTTRTPSTIHIMFLRRTWYSCFGFSGEGRPPSTSVSARKRPCGGTST